MLKLAVGLVTTSVSLGMVMLLIAGWQGTRFFRILRSLLSPLLSVPHAAAAFGLAFLIAPSGWLMRLVSPWASGLDRPPDWLIVNDPLALSMMAGLIAKEVPFILLVSLAALPQSDLRRKAALAATLGYGLSAASSKPLSRWSTGRSGCRFLRCWPMPPRLLMWRLFWVPRLRHRYRCGCCNG